MLLPHFRLGKVFYVCKYTCLMEPHKTHSGSGPIHAQVPIHAHL